MKEEKKIKLLYILPSLGSGGAERFTLDLIYHLDLNRFDPYLLLFSSSGFFYNEALEKGVKIKILKKRFKIDLFNFLGIFNYIRRIKPDIVHTQLGGDYYGKIAAKLAGVKNIISTEQNVSSNDNNLLRCLKKKTARFSKKIVAISSAVKEDLINKYQVPESKIPLIFNGVNIEKFQQDRKAGFDDREIVLGSVGRLHEQKNFSLLIKALSKLKSTNFKCLILGSGPLEEDLKQEIKDLKLDSRVFLLGSSSDVKGFLAQLDFFVLPSKWEGLGIVLLEAGLSSLPVLASATGGILDLIKDQETGVLFENGNLDDLVNKLEYFLNPKNKEILDTWGVNLFNFVKNNFSMEKIAQDYQKLYLEIIRE